MACPVRDHRYNALGTQAAHHDHELVPAEGSSTYASKLGESPWQANLARHATFPLGCCYLLLAIASIAAFITAACSTSLLPSLAALHADVWSHGSGYALWWCGIAMLITSPGWFAWSAAVMLCPKPLHPGQTFKTTSLTNSITHFILDHQDFNTVLHGHWFVLDALLPWIWLVMGYSCSFIVTIVSSDRLPHDLVVCGWVSLAVLMGFFVSLVVHVYIKLQTSGQPLLFGREARERNRQQREAAWQRVLAARGHVYGLDAPAAM